MGVEMFRFVKVFFILFLVVQTTVSTVVSMEKHYDDFCLVGELSGRRFVISNGKFDGDFTFYSHTNVKIIDEWSLTTFDKGMYECITLPSPPTTLPFQNITTEVQVYGEEYGRIYESKFTETDFGNQTYDSYCLVNDFHNNDRKYQYVQRTNHQIKSFYHSLGNYEISISLRNLVQKCDRVSGGETLTRSDDVVECRIEDEISFLDGSQHYWNRRSSDQKCTEDDLRMVSERKNQ